MSVTPSLFRHVRIGVSYVPHGRFLGSRWHHYVIPSRLTLRVPGRMRVYRWLVWNISIGSGT